MGPLTAHAMLVVVLGLILTLPAGHTMVLTEGSRVTDEDTGNVTEVDNLWSPLQRRQDLLDNRMNDRDTRLNGLDTRLNEVSARLNTRRNEVNTRLNRMDSRLDGIETAISDMKEFLQLRMDAMDKKLEWALTDINPRPKASTVLPDTKPQQDVTEIPRVHTGCQDALTHGVTNSGVYTITPVQGNSFNVFCEQLLEGGGWTVFQARKDGSVNFFNDWNSYKVGFGELTGEFWLGNSKIHLLTKHQDMELLVELTSADGEVEKARYTHFWINGEADMFRLSVRGYSSGSSPGDALAHNNGRQFSTVDNSSGSCTTLCQGAWWYGSCTYSNLNGLYGGEGDKALYWYQWKDLNSMSATRMMMRRRS